MVLCRLRCPETQVQQTLPRLPGIRLLDIRRNDDQKRLVADRWRDVFQDAFVQAVGHALVRQLAAQTILHLAQKDRFV